MKLIGLWIAVLAVALPTPGHPQSPARADLVGTWAGGRQASDSPWVAVFRYDTLVLRADSTYRHASGWYRQYFNNPGDTGTGGRWQLDRDTLTLQAPDAGSNRARYAIQLKGQQFISTASGESPFVFTRAGPMKPNTIVPFTPGDTLCPRRDSQGSGPPEGRPSPLDSVSFKIGGGSVKVCYGRPSLRGRTRVVGDTGEGEPRNNPFGAVWRTGANEPTMVFTSRPITFAGVKVPAGKFTLFSIPQEKGDWVIIVSAGTRQWGNEYDPSWDFGRGTAKRETPTAPIEQFTIRPDNPANAKELLLEWETFRIHVPLGAD